MRRPTVAALLDCEATMSSEYEKRRLIDRIRADIARATGRRYDRLALDDLDVEFLRELVRLLRDLDDEHRIDRRRNRDALERLMGKDFAGIRVTDRLATYDNIPDEQRQLCWAHLERDFRALAQGPAEGRAFGEGGLAIAQALMRCVRLHKQHGDRDRFEDEVRPYLGELIELLVDGACADIPKVSGFAAHLLARAESLWVFADREGVPPSNNIAERAIRKAVLWRKSCFGSQSDRGLRFADRMMTVIATKRRRAEGVLDYLVEVARAATRGKPAPELMPQPVHG